MAAEGPFSAFKSIWEKYELDMAEVLGQGYDGCSTMSGAYSGVHELERFVSGHTLCIASHITLT